MNLADVPDDAFVFVDANILVYHFAADPTFGAACTDLMSRVERKEIQALTSTHSLSDMAHRLMTVEAMLAFGWPAVRIAQRLRGSQAQIAKLKVFREALDEIVLLGVQVVPVSVQDVIAAAALSQQYDLLSGDALAVAVMRAHNCSMIASQDADFDRVPGLTRYAAI